MKRLFIIFALYASVAVPASAAAEEMPSSSEETFRPECLWHLAELPAWWFFWNVNHEGMHALMSQYWDWKIVGFHPYPHFATLEEGGERRFFLGATYLRCVQKEGWHWNGRGYEYGDYWPACKGGSGGAAIAAAPYALNASVFVMSDLLLGSELADVDSFGGALLYMGGMVGPWINTAFATNGFTGGPDIGIFSERTGVPKWAAVLTVDAVAALGAWRLYVRGKDLLYDRKSRKEDRSAMISPMASGDGFGLNLTMRW